MSLFDRLKDALDRGLPGPHYDVSADMHAPGSHAQAAVLVPITARSEPGLILTQRPEWLRRHAGQVAFPGGRMDPEDADEIATALREAQEEIGLPPGQVRIIGKAPPYLSGSGFHITPVLGIVPPDLIYEPCPDEVASIFEVPLSFVLDRANAELRTTDWNGIERQYFDMQWQGRRIWGVTAGILHNLSHQLGWPFDKS